MALYVICYATPVLALAVGNGHIGAYCLTLHEAASTDDHTSTPDHQHDQGLIHVHSPGAVPDTHSGPQHDHGQKCCGLFCVPSLGAEQGPTLDRPQLKPALFFPPETFIFGRTPDRIDRPPIPFLSM
jgi:hypothetical protein